jgi:serine/threonine-protein kinase
MGNNIVEKQKNFLEDLSKEKPESFREEVFVPVQKRPGRIIATLIAIVIVIIFFTFILQLSKITVPDMSKWQLEDVQNWVTKYHDNTQLNGVYNKDISQNIVISQDIKPGKKLKKNQTFTITYSLGADPQEAIVLPEIKNMSLTEIKTWISDNQLGGISIKYETSEVIQKDKVITYEFVDGSAEEFLRKNRMAIYVSSGSEDMSETFQMPDFYGKTRAEVTQWAKEQQIEVTIQEVFNEYVEYGKVYEQSIKKDTKITRKDLITVDISRGKSIQMPEFLGMSRSEATELATIYGMNVFFKLEVSNEEVDTVIRQDIAEGTEIDQKQMITLQIAKEEGKILVPNFTGLNQAEVNNLAGLYGLKVFLRNLEEAGANGIVTSQSIASGERIKEKQIVTLEFKESKTVTIPNFIGMTKNEATVLAKNLSIDLIFNEVETTKTLNQTITNQNIKANNQIGVGESVLLTLAINSGIRVKNMWNMSLKEAQAWATQKGITLNVVDNYNSEYSAGELYYQDCNANEWLPIGKILTVYHSLGFVMVEDFIGKTKSDILKWRDEINSKGANIELSFTDDTNTAKEKGVITGQSIKGELVALDRSIRVWVSATDNGVLIKNFDGAELEDFKLWCDINDIPYIVKDYYSDTYEEETLYGQNYTNTYLPKGEYLRISHSLGKVYVTDFTYQTKSAMIEWQRGVNKKNADIKIIFVEEYSHNVEKGKIVSQNVKDTEIDLNGTIVVTVSSGS